MIRHRGFPYLFDSEPGLGVAASHVYEGWTRINLYAPAGLMPRVREGIESGLRPEAPGEQVIFSQPAGAAGISAGGISLEGISMLALQREQPQALLERLEARVPALRVLDRQALEQPSHIEAAAPYLALYHDKLPALLRLAPHGDALQLELAGVCRLKDAPLIDDWAAELGKLASLFEVPAPFRSVEDDQRASLRVFILRAPLRAGAMRQVSARLTVWPGMLLYAIGRDA